MSDSARLDDASAALRALVSYTGKLSHQHLYPDRVMHRSGKGCQLQCAYCFADFRSFQSSSGQGAVQAETTGDFVILYPTCDSEFQGDRQARTEIERIILHTDRKVCISISTKAVVTPTLARNLAEWNAKLTEEGRGLVKYSLSITSKNHIADLEPFASTYAGRIASLQELAARGVPTSVNFKPVLPMVPVDEYGEIVEDVSPYCTKFLTGGLYLDLSTPFGAEIEQRYRHFVTPRRVEWLKDDTIWPYCEDPRQIEDISTEIVSRGGSAFTSDVDLVNALLEPSRMRS